MAVETRQIHGKRKGAQRSLPSQIEIQVEVTHGKFTQRSINRLTIAATGEIRFRKRTPVAVDPENCHYMVGVSLGFKIQE